MAARGQNHRKGKNKQAYAPKPKIPPPPKREDLAKDLICHECGEIGHWKRNCPWGFFEKQKLTGPNFIDWYRQLRIVLSIKDKLNYLEQPIPLVPVAPAEHPIPPAPVAPGGQQVAPEILAAHAAWVKRSKEIVGLMLMTMEPDIQQNLKPLHAHEMLKELKTMFAQQAKQELLQTTRDFHSCR
nr:zinc finger, CCHC-type [Tanacetum cinerariifolium]